MYNTFLSVLIIIMLVGCQSSKITHTWKDKDITPRKYNKILVLGVLNEDDHELQSKMERHIAGDLNELGYSAFAASDVYPANTFIKGDTIKAIEAINSKGFDAVLTIVLLNKEKEKSYVPGKPVSTPSYTGQFDRYYLNMHDRISTEGYYTTTTRIFWQSNFYDYIYKKMIYASQTRSFDPGSRDQLAHRYGLLLVNNLVKNQVLIKPEEPRY